MAANPTPADRNAKKAERPKVADRVKNYALLVGVGIADVRRAHKKGK